MNTGSCGRSEMEWALWRTFVRARMRGSSEIPKVFRTRIKRLLEIDRALDLDGEEVPPEASYAFAVPPEFGESAYQPIDAFCLAIALDLLDAGFKQTEVVFLMRYLRSELEDRYSGFLRPPSLNDRQWHRAIDHPDLPVWTDKRRSSADNRTFLIIQKIEITEIFPLLAKHKGKMPIFQTFIFCEGLTALSARLHDLMPQRRRALSIVEVAATAQSIQYYFENAPRIRRGRPKS